MASTRQSHEDSAADEAAEYTREDDDDTAPPQPSSVSDKKCREQNAIFDAWVSSESGRRVLASTIQRHGGGSVDVIESLGVITARQQKDAQIIQSPREYQIELFERAKQRNTIAVLDTGSGKTLIAILLLRWVIEGELENRPLGRRPKISFFLVPAVNLVFQQHSVLERNLDFKISRLCGADGIDSWQKDAWEKLFATHHAVVCTAEILHICLSQGFINIDRINLLIFDEAHHSKGNHPYAKILRDFYHLEKDPANRPHVFGMTASPVDGNGEVSVKATELERLLDSRIATTSNMSLSGIIKKPSESYANHARLPRTACEPGLLRAFRERFGRAKFFEKLIKTALEITKSLGLWFADTYLLDALSDEQQISYEIDLQKRYNCQKRPQDSETLEEALVMVREAIAWAQSESSRFLTTSGDITSKVAVLKQILEHHYGRRTDYRCIVFVEQRSTARLLHEYFEANKVADTELMISGFVTGARWAQLDELRSTHRKQMLTLMKFRNGDINCLFATQVAEEGLDVADCNLIIRFDLCKTMIQYVQSRGRARNQHSQFIHIIEDGNPEHKRLTMEARKHEGVMKRFCEALPADRYLNGSGSAISAPHGVPNLPYYIEPMTAAKLSFGNAMGLLANFASTVPADNVEPQNPEYVIERDNLGFTAKVLLPKGCPISSAIGHPHPRRILAKQSAAFEACVKLRSDNYIDEHLRSTYRKQLPVMRNALLAMNSKKKHRYPNRVKPNIWSEERGTVPSEVWVTVIKFDRVSDQPLQPLLLLTRARMPQFPDFPVYPDDSHERKVVSTPMCLPLAVTSTEVELLGTFMLRVFRDVFSKTYEDNSSKLSYWLCPCARTEPDDSSRSLIDWSSLHDICNNAEYKWTSGALDELLLNRFIVDPWSGARKFYSKSINKSLKPSDPVPDGVVRSKQVKSILDYSNSLWRKSREKAVWLADQPVIEAVLLPMRRNLLAPPVAKEMNQESRVFLCPEPLRISALPPLLVDTLVLFPAVIHRFESYLISIEGCRIAGIDCQVELALAAFTKDSDNSGDWQTTERINFQDGMGENYERLEFIGDTFLKLTTSLATFIASPGANEFESHVQRMLMLCNKNLFRVALDLKLYEYIRCTSFSRRLWYPEGIALLAGKGAKKTDGTDIEDFFHEPQEHPLGDKTIADVSEALIGAAFISHDRPGHWHRQMWDQAVQTVTKLVDNDGHRMSVWTDYSKAYQKPAYQTAPPTVVHRYLAEKIYEQEGHRFTHPRLLFSAFLHPSAGIIAEGVPSYQRLEFLGDALLDVAANTFLFHRHPAAGPQWLTEHKMAMVSNKFLGALCVTINFHTHLRHTNAALQTAIASYATEIQHARSLAGPLSRDFWVAAREPPKCLPDVVEAYVAALFIDADFDFAPVQRFFDTHFTWFFEDMSIYDSYANSHPIRKLEAAMRGDLGCGEWRLMAREVRGDGNGDEGAAVDVAVVMVHGQIVAACKGKSTRDARNRVAVRALEELEGMGRRGFRERFGCGCRREEEGEVGGEDAEMEGEMDGEREEGKE